MGLFKNFKFTDRIAFADIVLMSDKEKDSNKLYFLYKKNVFNKSTINEIADMFCKKFKEIIKNG